ncbi:hypothetical protein immuto35A_85 [Flavobacterium phage vB_FspM_immuto_3-5A]|uniref:Uncharacterized protein n=1 Tax=Flavobacterium phage vB_FspM_immuto_2-6A TaxID=2801477 RepID=A0A7T8ERH6_9CAUD|nr:hypothetical protein KNV73_gp185 [Flavobacterium phage vB_FspM_immuto_2-6A]QQO91765.1 hypothetical protein immuto26A_86 [Flavobacterium phage vB_FspM_immuto_2-6A]QQO92003.1 hypothetical protein immuto35A_85 [Flavobacterium phage vB_FspM_immuto_3-5A]QQO92241.1 hypothetical protein immuto136C_85 [Flavobacterium phage vB_FspM_immuto_13-6C]
MKDVKKYTLPIIIAISAISVSISAAYYSITGLSKLFAGASTEVAVMATSLEVSKLVIVSLLYRYWNSINKVLRTYLTLAATVLILITSMGIYGFLSAAYQDTYRGLEVKNNEISFITQKKDFYEKDVARFDAELERISSNITTLSNSKSSSIQVKDVSVVGGVRTTISTTEVRLAQKRIAIEEENRIQVQHQRQVAADSLQKFQLEILQLENNSDIAGELGPLEYLSGLTGISMDRIINVLLLVIIFVFDPLAISLVLAANFAFERIKGLGKLEEKWQSFQEELENRDWDVTVQDGLDEEEWDEDHSLDLVMNDMVKEEDTFFEDLNKPDEKQTPEKINSPTIVKILKMNPNRLKAEMSDGTTQWIAKKDFGNNENKITYL